MIDFICLNDNDITNLGQTETSGFELLLNHIIYWTFVFILTLIKIQCKKEIKKKDMNIKPQGLPKSVRTEKRTNFIWESNVWQEPQRGIP